MKLAATLAAMAGIGVALCAALAGPLSPEPAHAFGNPRIIVNVAGNDAGTVEFQNVESLLPEELFDNDTGDLNMPGSFCGLRVSYVGGIWWHDADGDVVEAENHGEIEFESGEGYLLMGEDVTDAYLEGMEFSGPLTTCDENLSWFFPIPLSYGGNGPQFGVQQLVLDLDTGGSGPTIEFLDEDGNTIDFSEIGDGDDDGGRNPGPGPDPDPGRVPWNATDDIVFGCVARDIWTGLCPREPEPKDYPDFTLGCLAYATGCDPDPQPQPIETYVAPSAEPQDQILQVAPQTEKLAPASP